MQMQIEMKLTAGRSTLAINGQTADLQTQEHVKLGWAIIKAALFAKHPEYEVGRLLRSAK